MSTRGRLLLAVALAAGLVFAAAYYASQEFGIGRSGSTRETRRDGTPITEPVDQPATEALFADQSEEPAEDQGEATAGEQQQLGAVEERIRSFTIPVERALAGMEDLDLRVSIPPIPEFKETLRQFAAESDDPNWSVTTETRIFSEISQATGLGAGDIQVDCRTTMCRVLLTNPSSSPNPRYRSFNELIDSFGLKTVWLLAIPDENGTPVSFAYIQRGEGATTQSESQ
jgi:hypothetical protein